MAKIFSILRWESGLRVAIYLLLVNVSWWWLFWAVGLISRSFRYNHWEFERFWICSAISVVCWTVYNDSEHFGVWIAGTLSVICLAADAIEGSDQTYFRRLLTQIK